MAMTVKRVKDTMTPKVFVHKVADVRGGVSIKASELGGEYLPEGAVISAPENGICHVIKLARLTARYAGSGKKIQVTKNSCFKTGDFVMTKVGGKAYAVTSIDYSKKEYDTISVGTDVDAAEIGGHLILAKQQATGSESALKYEAFALVGTGKSFTSKDNIDEDAWLIGVTKGNPLPECLAGKLTGIINY